MNFSGWVFGLITIKHDEGYCWRKLSLIFMTLHDSFELFRWQFVCLPWGEVENILFKCFEYFWSNFSNLPQGMLHSLRENIIASQIRD